MLLAVASKHEAHVEEERMGLKKKEGRENKNRVGLAKASGWDRPPSPSAYFDHGFYSDAHSFRKITVAFSRTADAQQAFGWCS